MATGSPSQAVRLAGFIAVGPLGLVGYRLLFDHLCLDVYLPHSHFLSLSTSPPLSFVTFRTRFDPSLRSLPPSSFPPVACLFQASLPKKGTPPSVPSPTFLPRYIPLPVPIFPPPVDALDDVIFLFLFLCGPSRRSECLCPPFFPFYSLDPLLSFRFDFFYILSCAWLDPARFISWVLLFWCL